MNYFKITVFIHQLTFEQAIQFGKRSVAGIICSKLLTIPRIECGTIPNNSSGIEAFVSLASTFDTEIYAGQLAFFGCWLNEMSNSTAKLAAIFETAGLVTVHC